MNKRPQTCKDVEAWVHLLGSADGAVREKARASLVSLGAQAVPALSEALLNSKAEIVRWEAAKSLGAIGDAEAIPALVDALEDPDPNVAWLVAEALEDQRKSAWPELFHALVERGADSSNLRHNAHHVLRRQRANDFSDLLEDLVRALESLTVPESTPIAAYRLLERMKERSEA